jgi:hypothetical protein
MVGCSVSPAGYGRERHFEFVRAANICAMVLVNAARSMTRALCGRAAPSSAAEETPSAISFSRWANAIVVCVVALTPVKACAADARVNPDHATVLPPVEVRALRDPVEKSYRKIVRGMDVFEQRHDLAPEASLRFKLLPRTRQTNMEGIALTIAGESVSIAVKVAPDNTFALERFPQALREDAAVTPNRTAGSMTWRTEIRTPGVPPDTRRLGDLRLECRVGVEAELVSDFRPFFGHIARLMRPRDYCDQREVHYLFFAERPLFSVTLVAGGRREVLPVDQLYAGISRNPMSASELHYCDCEVLVDRTYYAPLGDRTWPDDTLLVFEYMDDNVASATSDSPSAEPDGASR